MAKKSCTYVIVYEPGAMLVGTYRSYIKYSITCILPR